MDFTVKEVASRCECAEALVYKYYGDREGLIAAARLKLSESAKKAMEESVFPLFGLDMPSSEKLKRAFIAFLRSMVEAKNDTVFHSALMASRYRNDTLEGESEFLYDYYEDIACKLGAQKGFERLVERIPFEYVCAHLIESCNNFARMIIRGDIPDTDESYEHIYRVVCLGIPDILNE